MKITKGHIQGRTKISKWGNHETLKSQTFFNDENENVASLLIHHKIDHSSCWERKARLEIEYYTFSIQNEEHYNTTTKEIHTELSDSIYVWSEDGRRNTIYNKMGMFKTRKEVQSAIRRSLKATEEPKNKYKIKVAITKDYDDSGVFFFDCVCIDSREEVEELVKNLIPCNEYQVLESIEIIDLEEEEEEEREEEERGCYVVALYYTNGELETFRLPLITDREEAQKFCDLYEQQQQVDKARLILSPNK